MKVYVLELQVDYEGSTLYGVFSTPQKAKDFCNSIKTSEAPRGEWLESTIDEEWSIDTLWGSYTVTASIVDEPE